MKLRIQVLISLVCLCTAGAVGTRSLAVEWIDPQGGNFDDPGNWSFPGVPDMFEQAFFLLNEDYTVTFPGTQASSSTVVIGAGNVVFNFTGAEPYLVNGQVLVGINGLPNGSAPPVSLTVNGGLVHSEATFEIYNGARLAGDGQVFANSYEVFSGGQVTGTLHLGGGINNHGLVAPGNGAGVMTLNGDFSQFADGTLEIEVGGTLPGTQHDQLQVGASTFLGGRLLVPFINGYTPSAGHNITFMQQGNPFGQFDSLVLPDLSGSLAAEINYGISNVTLSFVNAVPVPFNSLVLNVPPSPPNLPNHWGNAAFWPVNVPTSKNVVNLVNQTTGPKVIELNTTASGSKNAFVHEIAIAGDTNLMTLVVPTNTNFTAVKTMNVGNNGIVELKGGTVHSKSVNVNAGGLLRGNGKINGDLVVGAGPGTALAVVSPGFSVGEIEVHGDLTVGGQGSLEVEVFSTSSFDLFSEIEQANLGGTLKVVGGGGMPLPVDGETEVAVLTADNVNMRFDDVITTGVPGHFFAPNYTASAVSLSLYQVGDMNRNGILEPGADPEAFAKAVRFPSVYYTDHGIRNYVSGNIDGVNGFDFDDFDDFAAIPDFNMTLSDLMDIVEAYTLPVPEPQAWLLVLSGSVLLGLSRHLPAFDAA